MFPLVYTLTSYNTLGMIDRVYSTASIAYPRFVSSCFPIPNHFIYLY